MADILKNRYAFGIGLRFCHLEDCNQGFTKFQLNSPYLGYNTESRTKEVRHYGSVCDVSETGLFEKYNQCTGNQKHKAKKTLSASIE